MPGPLVSNVDHSVFVLIQARIGEDYLNPDHDVHRFKDLSTLTPLELGQIAPNIVVCPLFTLRFDAIDVGKLMIKAGVNAKLLIEAPTLPRPGIVVREISEACPGLNFDFFDMQRWLNRCTLTA